MKPTNLSYRGPFPLIEDPGGSWELTGTVDHGDGTFTHTFQPKPPPPDKSGPRTATARLKDTRTGQEREYSTFYDDATDYNVLWHWTRGNYGCDCNRSLFFYNHDEREELECNQNANTIVLLSLKCDGRELLEGA